MSHYKNAIDAEIVMRDNKPVNAADECNRLWSTIVRNEKRLETIRRQLSITALSLDNLAISFRKSGEDL
jgi:hypothetical protein